MTDLLDPPRAEAREPVEAATAAAAAVSGPAPAPARALLAALLIGAGAIHLALTPSHLAESAVEGAGFLVAAWAQIALAVALLTRPRRWMLAAVVALSLALIGAWAWSRTAGLPFGAHSGHAESVSFVDAACVALEVVAVLVALVALLRPGARLLRSGAMALVGGLAVLGLTTAAIASPSARDHAAASHGEHGAATTDDHGDHGAADDDLGFAALQNGQMGSHEHPGEGAEIDPTASIDPATAGELAGQLALTAPLAQAYPTLGAAKAAGFTQAGPFSPGLGIHYMRGFNQNADGVMDEADIASPFLIFDGYTDDAPLAGFMYMIYRETEPPGFAGELDRWHYHTNVCIVYTPDGVETPFGADLTDVTAKMCEDAGGSFLDFTGYMVHVWTVPGYESSLGTFSELNPAITCPDGTYHTIPIAEVAGKDTTCQNP